MVCLLMQFDGKILFKYFLNMKIFPRICFMIVVGLYQMEKVNKLCAHKSFKCKKTESQSIVDVL